MKRITLFFIFTLSTCLFPMTGMTADGAAIAMSTTLLKVGPRERTATVSVANRTDTLQRYRVSVVDMAMNEDGTVTRTPKDAPGHAGSASGWVIATPSSIKLKPKESQSIRLLIRRPKGLTDGEYRTHLLVAQEPPADIAGGLKEAPQEEGMKFNIVTVYSTSIPITIQQGELQSSAKIDMARFDAEGKKLTLGVFREGNASFRGFVTLDNGAASPLAVIPVTVYPERDRIERDYEVAIGEGAENQVQLSLYAGEIPRPGEPLPGAPVDSRTIALP